MLVTCLLLVHSSLAFYLPPPSSGGLATLRRGTISSSSSGRQPSSSSRRALDRLHCSDVSVTGTDATFPEAPDVASGGSSPTSIPPAVPPSLYATVHALIPCLYMSSKLMQSILRLLPYTYVPLETLSRTTIVPLYVSAALFFAYYEAYKGFHLKFTPMFVSRAFNLHTQNALYRYPLSPFYATGLFQSTTKRKVASIGVTLAVMLLIVVSKRLAPLSRGILDVGVVTGLGLGIVSLWYHFVGYMLSGRISLPKWSKAMEGYPA